jgi:iron complex outermembrane receptor protein
MNRSALCQFRASALMMTAVSALPLFSTQAFAQEQQPGKPSQTVETVVVTAERRATNLQTTAISASVLSGEDLAKKGVNVVDQLMFSTPALTVSNFGQGNQFNIRGIGKGENNVQTPSGVTTYVNGAAIPGTFFQDFPFYDLSSIEVLRGPQGTFSGENATAGAVYITTTRPSLDGYNGYVQAQAGNYADFGLQSAVNIPVSDDLAIRVAGYGEKRNSFWEIMGPHSGDAGSLLEGAARFEVLWHPTNQFEAYFSGEYVNVDRGGYPADPATISCVTLPTPACVPNTSDQFKITKQDVDKGLESGERAVLDLRYTFDGGIALRSISSYQASSVAGNYNLSGTDIPAYAGFDFFDHGEEKVVSQELNLLSPDDKPLTWILGAFFQHDHVDLPENGGFDIGVPVTAANIELTYHTPKQHEAVFGQATYDITSALQFQLGLRFNHSSFDLQDEQQTVVTGLGPVATFLAPCPSPVGPGVVCSNLTHQSDSALTGKVGFNYTLDPDNFFYVFAATGHKDGALNTTPSINGPNNPPAEIKPENLQDYEIGWKATNFDGHLHTTLDGFYDAYKDFQVTLATGPGQTGILNTKRATIEGVEAQGQAVFGDLSFDFSAAYVHGTFGSDIATDSRFGDTIDISGNQMVFSPHLTANAGVQYAFDLGNGNTLTPRIDYAFVDGQETSVFAVPGLDGLSARNIVNALLTYTMQDNWMVEAYATNLNNDHYTAAYATGLGILPGTSANLRYAGPPRQFGIRIAKYF